MTSDIDELEVVKKKTVTNREVVKKPDPDGGYCFTLDETRANPTRISVRKYKGRLMVDIRQMYKDDDSGEWKYGKKGISLSQSEFREMAKIFHLIKEAFVEMGGDLNG